MNLPVVASIGYNICGYSPGSFGELRSCGWNRPLGKTLPLLATPNCPDPPCFHPIRFLVSVSASHFTIISWVMGFSSSLVYLSLSLSLSSILWERRQPQPRRNSASAVTLRPQLPRSRPHETRLGTRRSKKTPLSLSLSCSFPARGMLNPLNFCTLCCASECAEERLFLSFSPSSRCREISLHLSREQTPSPSEKTSLTQAQRGKETGDIEIYRVSIPPNRFERKGWRWRSFRSHKDKRTYSYYIWGISCQLDQRKTLTLSDMLRDFL